MPRGDSYGDRFGSFTGQSLSKSEQLEAESCKELQRKRIPCVLLTGFLGSGKTTLLNRILAKTTLKLVVLENEVGEASVDDELLVAKESLAKDTEVVLLPNGCMCCRVRGDLVQAFKSIAAKVTVEGVVLELSGLSSLAPVMQTFFSDPYVQSRLLIDSVVCLVDAAQGEKLLTSTKDLSVKLLHEQLSLSDKVFINKVDLLDSPDDLVRLSHAVKEVNSTATVYSGNLRNGSGDVAFIEELFQKSMFALKNVEKVIMDVEEKPHEHHHHSHNVIGYTTRSFVQVDAPIDFYKFEMWLEENVLKPFPDKLVRCKGILWSKVAGEDQRIVMQGVYGHVEMSRPSNSSSYEGSRSSFGKVDDRKSVLVFIGQLDDEDNIGDLIEQGIQKCTQKV